MTNTILGLDVGGAGLKAATNTGEASEIRYELWRDPIQLTTALLSLRARYAPRHVVVTMTAELCDCYADKAAGVSSILAAVEQVFIRQEVAVWLASEDFVTPSEARRRPWEAGASNWVALACWLAPQLPTQNVLLLDMGSTTTDIIPLRQGRLAAAGRSDPERLRTGELVYQGLERTPLCALLPSVMLGKTRYRTMAEWFATTRDAYLILGLLAEDNTDTRTADGRPATVEFARARLARMIGSDSSRFSLAEAVELATQAMTVQAATIRGALEQVLAASLSQGVDLVLVCGQGAVVTQRLLETQRPTGMTETTSVLLWSQLFPTACAQTATAMAVARLWEQKSLIH